MRIRKHRTIAICVATLICCFDGSSFAQDDATLEVEGSAEDSVDDLIDLDLDELMNMDVEVTSVSRKSQKLTQSAAAIFAVTGDDIRRMGALSIPDALRYVPGVQVSRSNSSTWAIGSRGLTNQFTNNLLVMMDGRSIYNSIFGGVYWNSQNTLLEDVDRIEVVRGPGGTMWGANAVNGIINIISKSSEDTQGLLVSAATGTEDRALAAMRYGGKIGDKGFYRVYTKYNDRDNGFGNTTDAWSHLQGGFRTDWNLSSRDTLTVQGDIYTGLMGQTGLVVNATPPPGLLLVPEEEDVFGANLLARWSRQYEDNSSTTLQFYYDEFQRDAILASVKSRTIDLEFQHQIPFSLAIPHELMWGAGYRFNHQELNQFNPTLSFTPGDFDTSRANLFVQDEMTLVEDRLKLTLGSKFEYNEFTGIEIQPSARMAWTPDDNQTFWAAVSRAVRTPTRVDEHINLIFGTVGGLPVLVTGNPQIESEDALVLEMGYRSRPFERVSVDATAFWNHYENLSTVTPIGPAGPVFLSNFQNGEDADSLGFELSSTIQVLENEKFIENWSIKGTYSWMRLDSASPGGALGVSREGNNPRNMFTIRSSMDLPFNLELDIGLRYMDNVVSAAAPSHFLMDARVAWKPREDLELAIVGQHLLDDKTPEFPAGTAFTLPSSTEHAVFAKLTWTFD